MCGIAGIVSINGINNSDLKSISKSIRHRGPDDEGFVVVSNHEQINFFIGDDSITPMNNIPHISSFNSEYKNQIALLHRRLSILDLSINGHQPMSSSDNTLIISFNGEIYNYKELREELKLSGFQFKTDSDTEVILYSYKKWGKECVHHFKGMWAFAMYDATKQELFISRDRFGIKPLYYYYDNSHFVFASEIKALFQLSFIKPEGNLTSAMEYIAFGATSLASGNLFKNIHTLSPANNLILNTQTLKHTTHQYYNIRDKVNTYNFSNLENIEEHFKHLLYSSIDMHLRADVSVGSTLSGGLDSSTLVAIVAKKLNHKPFKTFTAAYNEKDIDESDFVKKVADQYKNIDAHFTYPSANNYWKDIDKLIWHQDLPINSTSMFAQWEVMKLANQNNIKVLLDGQGADEILGGYYNFAGIYLIEKLLKLNIPDFIKERNALRTNFSPNIDNTIGKAAYYFLPEFAQKSIRAKKRLGMHAFNPQYTEIASKIDVPARGGKTFKQQSLLSIEFGLQDLLRYEDRNSMAFSIESRVPFLDNELVEFCIALNNNYKIKNGWTKYILRKNAEPILDKEVVWRKYKMGFLTPQKLWKQQSQETINQYLNDFKVPDFIDKNYILKLNESNLNDTHHLSEFWKFISFIKWVELYKVTF